MKKNPGFQIWRYFKKEQAPPPYPIVGRVILKNAVSFCFHFHVCDLVYDTMDRTEPGNTFVRILQGCAIHIKCNSVPLSSGCHLCCRMRMKSSLAGWLLRSNSLTCAPVLPRWPLCRCTLPPIKQDFETAGSLVSLLSDTLASKVQNYFWKPSPKCAWFVWQRKWSSSKINECCVAKIW